MKKANARLETAMCTANVMEEFQVWKQRLSKNAMFRATLNYMHRAEVVLFFVAASRNADMTIRVAAGEQLSKLFFSMYRIKYKRLWLRYISDMHDLRTTYPDTWNELVGGSLSVSKNGIPFTSVGADHACEHLNRQMKVKSGLVGISVNVNVNARQKFFLATPEISRMSAEYRRQFHMDMVSQLTEHHDLSPSEVSREHSAVN